MKKHLINWLIVMVLACVMALACVMVLAHVKMLTVRPCYGFSRSCMGYMA